MKNLNAQNQIHHVWLFVCLDGLDFAYIIPSHFLFGVGSQKLTKEVSHFEFGMEEILRY